MAFAGGPLPDWLAVKVDRAQVHIRTLDDELKRIFEEQPYEPWRKQNADGTVHTYGIQPIPKIPLGIGPIIGDAVGNLRSALDHLAWQLVLANGGTPTDKTQFPIPRPSQMGRQRVLHVYAKGRKSVHPDAEKLINSFYDGSGANPILGGNLIALNELCRVDKHQTIWRCAPMARLHYLPLPDGVPSPELSGWIGPIEQDDTPLLTLTFPSPCPDIDFHPPFGLDVALQGIAATWPGVNDVLIQLRWEVESHIIPPFLDFL